MRLPGRDNSVTRDQLGENTASGLDTKGKGRDIDEDKTLSAFFPTEDTTLDSGTIGNCLIGINAFRRLLATKELLEELLNLRDTGRSTDEYNLVQKLKTISKNKTKKYTYFIDFFLLHICVFKDLFDRLHRLTEKIDVELLKFGTGECF